MKIDDKLLIDDELLIGLPAPIAVTIRESMADSAQDKRIARAHRHEKYGDFHRAKMIMNSLVNDQTPSVRLEAARGILRLGLKVGGTAEQFIAAGREINSACDRGNSRALALRQTMSRFIINRVVGPTD